MTLIAITIAIVMGLATSMYMRQISTQGSQYSAMYSASQAHWSALSGIEYGLYKSEIGEADFGGPYSFYNSTIAMDTSETDESGGALADFRYRVISKGTHGSAERYLRILTKMSMKTVWGDVSIIEGSGDIQIRSGIKINDSLYIGQDVSVATATVIGEPPDAATHIYLPPGASLTVNGTHNYLTSGQHSHGWLFTADFDTDPYDSLLTIANAITTTSENKFKGTQRFKETTLDLNGYLDSTIYIKGDLFLQAMAVTGGSSERPGIIVVTDDLYLESRKGVETTVGDNIIMIAGDILELDDATIYGSDQSAYAPEDRPNLHNECFAQGDLIIRGSAILWGQGYATDDMNVEGEMHGIAYAPDKFRFTKSTSNLEGAIFATNIIGSAGPNRMDQGVLNLNHFFHEEYFSTFDYGVIANSLLEY